MGALVSRRSPKRRILIVDDEPELVRALTLRQVSPDGYVVKSYQPAELLEMVGRLTAATWEATGRGFSNPDRQSMVYE